MEHHPLDKYEENDGKKILKECVHTRNRHIELETRYEKLVSRKSSGINLEEIEAAMREEESDPSEENGVEENVCRQNTGETGESENGVSGTDCGDGNSDEDADTGTAEEDNNLQPDEKREEIIYEPGSENDTVSFEEIIKIQKSILERISERSREELETFLFGPSVEDSGDYPEYTGAELKKIYTFQEDDIREAPLCEEDEPEAEGEQFPGEENPEDRIISVAVDEIILPEDSDHGLGIVYASPLKNEKYREKDKPHSAGKSILGIVLAEAVLVAGVLLVYNIWPAGI